MAVLPDFEYMVLPVLIGIQFQEIRYVSGKTYSFILPYLICVTIPPVNLGHWCHIVMFCPQQSDSVSVSLQFLEVGLVTSLWSPCLFLPCVETNHWILFCFWQPKNVSRDLSCKILTYNHIYLRLYQLILIFHKKDVAKTFILSSISSDYR